MTANMTDVLFKAFSLGEKDEYKTTSVILALMMFVFIYDAASKYR